ncbi:hypothetical protein RUND412_007071 [Rhizina undulata]
MPLERRHKSQPPPQDPSQANPLTPPRSELGSPLRRLQSPRPRFKASVSQPSLPTRKGTPKQRPGTPKQRPGTPKRRPATPAKPTPPEIRHPIFSPQAPPRDPSRPHLPPPVYSRPWPPYHVSYEGGSGYYFPPKPVFLQNNPMSLIPAPAGYKPPAYVPYSHTRRRSEGATIRFVHDDTYPMPYVPPSAIAPEHIMSSYDQGFYQAPRQSLPTPGVPVAQQMPLPPRNMNPYPYGVNINTYIPPVPPIPPQHLQAYTRSNNSRRYLPNSISMPAMSIAGITPHRPGPNEGPPKGVEELRRTVYPEDIENADIDKYFAASGELSTASEYGGSPSRRKRRRPVDNGDSVEKQDLRRVKLDIADREKYEEWEVELLLGSLVMTENPTAFWAGRFMAMWDRSLEQRPHDSDEVRKARVWGMLNVICIGDPAKRSLQIFRRLYEERELQEAGVKICESGPVNASNQ